MTTPTNPAVPDLVQRLAALRHEQAALITANGTLLCYGIGSQTAEIRDRLADIKAEAFAIADTLRTLGHHDQADAALDGWAIVVPRRKAVAA